MLERIARRLSEAALDRSELKLFARELKYWFAKASAPAAQLAATRVEHACQANVEPTKLASRVWALEHEIMRLLRFTNWRERA